MWHKYFFSQCVPSGRKALGFHLEFDFFSHLICIYFCSHYQFENIDFGIQTAQITQRIADDFVLTLLYILCKFTYFFFVILFFFNSVFIYIEQDLWTYLTR